MRGRSLAASRFSGLLALAVLFLTGSERQLPARAALARAASPNFVIVLTDDQRWDSLWAMPFVNETLRARSLEFVNAYVTTPECCPARASFLSGGFYAHNTGVLTNTLPNGGATKFDDRMALPVRLRRAGYKTALIGKYMNGYGEIAPHVPPGWTKFIGTISPGNWFSSTVVRGSSGSGPSVGSIEQVKEYILDYQFAEALDFLETTGGPFFLMVSVSAPHEPAVPEKSDSGLHQGFRYRERGYGEQNLADKPKFMKNRSARFNRLKNRQDNFHRDQLRTLASVDRGVEALYALLARRGLVDSTVFVFTSDNGFLWGEHRYFGKNVVYEESIRVPFMIATPEGRRGTDDHLVAMNLDLPATVLELSGAAGSRNLHRLTDGMSLSPLLEKGRQEDVEWRDELLIEQWSRVWASLLTRTPGDGSELEPGAAWAWKFVQHGTGEEEAYRAAIDPYELSSLHADPDFMAGRRDELANRLEELRGLAITTRRLAKGMVGVKYQDAVEVWGARPPYTWTIEEGELPRGVRLDPETGVLSGKPKERGNFKLVIRVESSKIARYTGQFQSQVREYKLKIGGSADTPAGKRGRKPRRAR
jgi:arylsulfatase A-like enzyme